MTYNGRTMDDFVVERASTYIEQVDEHMAELTCASCCRSFSAQNQPSDAGMLDLMIWGISKRTGHACLVTSC